MYIKRKIEHTILRYLHTPEIIAIVGPRQCGKTTTLQQIFKGLDKAVFLSFEDQSALELFEKNIKQFAQNYIVGKRYVFIDEFQYAKRGGKHLKYLYDAYSTKIIISGSSAVDLTVKAIKFLVGRIFVLPMFPFDFYEFLRYRDPALAAAYEKMSRRIAEPRGLDASTEQKHLLEKYYEEYALWGGYPRVALAPSREEKTEVLKNLYNTFFLREVKSILGLIDDFTLGKLLRALALQIGNMVEYRELANLSELSAPTVKRYLNFLSKTYICEFIKPFYRNKRKEIVKNQKVYFYDTGLRNFAVNDFRAFNGRPDAGALLENAFWMQMTKNEYTARYWRDKNKNEVDFIVDIGEGGLAAIEVKHSQNRCKDLPGAFSKDYKEAVAYCAYLRPDAPPSRGQQLFLPLVR